MVSSYRVHFIDENFTWIWTPKKKFRFLAHLDFLPPWLNQSMEWRTDWSTAGRKVTLNNAETFTVVRPQDDNLFRVNGGTVELRHVLGYSIIAYTKILGISLLQVQFYKSSYNAIIDCNCFPPEHFFFLIIILSNFNEISSISLYASAELPATRSSVLLRIFCPLFPWDTVIISVPLRLHIESTSVSHYLFFSARLIMSTCFLF